jgi:hypothetical protein
VIVVSCQNAVIREEKKIKTFDLKKLPETTSVKLSDLGFVDIEYIPLETTEQSLITGSDDFITGNKIIVENRFLLTKHWNTILEFQNNGSFVARIGKKGRGPDEITVAHDVDIDEKNQNIYLLCGWGKKFNVYSENGDFIRAIQIPIYSTEFRFVEDGILCYAENHMGNIDNSYNLIDTNGRIIKSFPNKFPFNTKDAYLIWHENLFYQFNNSLFKKEVYCDTVYVFENKDFKPHLVIDVGERLITPKARSEFDAFYIGENFIDPMNLFEFGDYVYYQFIYKFKLPDDVLIYGFIGSKKNDFRALIGLGEGLTNDLDGGPNILPLTTKDDNTIIALIDALKFKNHVNSEAFINSKPKYPEKKKELEKLANSLKETDNPVLVLVKLKK